MYKKILFISLKNPSSCGLMNILKHMLAIFKHNYLIHVAMQNLFSSGVGEGKGTIVLVQKI